MLSPYLYADLETGFYGRAKTIPFKIKDKPPEYEYRVIFSASNLFYYDKDEIIGILAEEFLHYTFFVEKAIKREIIPTNMPEPEQRHKPDIWFQNRHIIEWFRKARKFPSLEEFSNILIDWSNVKGGPVSDGRELTKYEGEIGTVSISREIAEKLKEKGLI